eukprot:scaffold3712_cov145-Skeletonema_marinoi.AAC.4
MMPESSRQETDKGSSAKPVSLAVAADVAQIRLEDSPHRHSSHAMGQATAHRLKSLLSHISPPLANSLESELKAPIKSTTDPSSNDVVQKKNNDDDANIEASNEEQKVEDSPQTQPQSQQHHTENGFKRFLDRVDNFFLHPPSHSRHHHHHQGHRIGSIQTNGTTTHHSDKNTAACDAVCTLPSTNICNNNEQQKHTDQSEPQPQKEQTPQQKPRRHLPLFHSSHRLSWKKKLHIPLFHSHTAAKESPESQQEQREKTLKHQYRGVMLSGTTTWDQHEAQVKSILHICELYQLGYDLKEYSQKENDDDSITDDSLHNDATIDNSVEVKSTLFETRARRTLSSIGFEFQLDKCNACTESNTVDDSCDQCITRLYYTPSNTAITNENRSKFIADGKMYDAIADLCQSAAQEIMAEACDLVWVTVCDGKGGGLSARLDSQSSNLSSDPKSVREWPRDDEGNIIVLEPIRALVGRCKSGNENQSKDTFLVSTGKGKVSAGIFSRQHLLTTGLEPSTALPLLREARSRGMNCVVIDPNARGDRVGMDTFQVSVRSLFQQECSAEVDDAIIPASSSDGHIYVLAHSAAGGQLVRYLLDKNQCTLLPRIRSITFTDSTHSVQWLKKHPNISSLIQSSRALYVRSANPMRDDGWENAQPGDECDKDHFWSHRFGKIKTVWAGTTDHSLTNWAARAPIWEHFDKNANDDKAAASDDEAETSTHTDKVAK